MPELTLEQLLKPWCKEEVDCPCDWLTLVEWQQQRPPVWLRAQTTNYVQLKATLPEDKPRLMDEIAQSITELKKLKEWDVYNHDKY